MTLIPRAILLQCLLVLCNEPNERTASSLTFGRFLLLEFLLEIGPVLRALGLSSPETRRLRGEPLLSTATWGGEAEREVLSSAPRDQGDPVNPVGSREIQETGTGCVGAVQSCTRGGLDWASGSISLLRGWPDPGTGFLEGWSMPWACQCWRDMRTMPLTPHFDL